MALRMLFHSAHAVSSGQFERTLLMAEEKQSFCKGYQCSDSIYMRTTPLSDTRNLLRLKTHHAADQQVVRIAVSTVIAVIVNHVVQCGPPSDHQVKLMPMIGSEMTPRYSMLRLCREACFGDV